MAFVAGGTSGRRVLMSDEAMRALAEKAFEAKRLRQTKAEWPREILPRPDTG